MIIAIIIPHKIIQIILIVIVIQIMITVIIMLTLALILLTIILIIHHVKQSVNIMEKKTKV